MKKLIVAIALIFFASLGAEAQQKMESRERPSPEKVAERITEKMSKELELTEEQKTEIYALYLENAREKSKEMDLMREKHELEREAHQEKLNGILSPEQKEKWEAGKRELRKKRMAPEGKGKLERKEGKHNRPKNNNR